jgi:hypothetical protein
MKRTKLAILAAVMLLSALHFDACKKAEVETSTLTVILSEGVFGSPDAGTHTVEVGETLNYSYSLDEGYQKLTVLLDGAEVAASGTLKVTGIHTLQAYSDNNRQYTLNVTLSSGAAGTPAAGTYHYLQGTKVEYSYSLVEGYSGLAVTLDGATVTNSGTITMSQDHLLATSSRKKNDIQGAWSLTESYNDGSSFAVTVTFSGGLTSGTVTDSEGGSGTYDYTDDTLDFTLVFPEVTYKYSGGEFSDDANTISGTCKRYQDEANAVSGTWTATRGSSAASVPGGKRVSGKGHFRRQ